ncbi:MAG: hypothetical protein ACSHX6_03735 [Akkermansiaceae bacterium]
MDPPSKLKFASYTFNTLSILVPSLICLPIIPKLKKIRPINRYFIAIPATWLILVLYNDLYYWGARLQHATHRGNLSYDGAALNIMITLFGWIPPLITALPALLIAHLKHAKIPKP